MVAPATKRARATWPLPVLDLARFSQNSVEASHDSVVTARYRPRAWRRRPTSSDAARRRVLHEAGSERTDEQPPQRIGGGARHARLQKNRSRQAPAFTDRRGGEWGHPPH